MPVTRKESLENIRGQIAAGKAVIGAGAGTGKDSGATVV